MLFFKTPYKYYRYICSVLNIDPLPRKKIRFTNYIGNELLYYGDSENKDYTPTSFFRYFRYNEILDMYYRVASSIGYDNLKGHIEKKDSLKCKINKSEYDGVTIKLLTIISVIFLHEHEMDKIFEKSIEYIFKL
jgi:hypothetical protein